MSKLWSIRISASQYGMSAVRIKSGKIIFILLESNTDLFVYKVIQHGEILKVFFLTERFLRFTNHCIVIWKVFGFC